MNATDRVEEARAIMLRFAERTGVTSVRTPTRYLWTDAFAVCNFLGLERVDLARALVAQVHDVLGRHRDDDARRGLLGTAQHPTSGGLRIGKRLPERRDEDACDEALEWERDGQYFHYLTKWMHALDRMSIATGETRFNVWARELADVAHRAFVHGPQHRRRMFWKMSIDLSRPLVASMGQHDPLDGWMTCRELEATAARLGAREGPRLDAAIADYEAMASKMELSTTDPLGIGGLLIDAARATGALERELLAAATDGLEHFAEARSLDQPADRRLAFRELGLAIGLEAIRLARPNDATLRSFAPLRVAIEDFWRDPNHRRNATWLEHRDINDVMLATALYPNGFCG